MCVLCVCVCVCVCVRAGHSFREAVACVCVCVRARSDHSFREAVACVCVCVCVSNSTLSGNLKNEVAWARAGLL